jgi:hypothetical protein
MPLTKLTPRNQLRAFYEDIDRMKSGEQMLHSIGQHVELLIKRMDALEASVIEAATAGETTEGKDGDTR